MAAGQWAGAHDIVPTRAPQPETLSLQQWVVAAVELAVAVRGPQRCWTTGEDTPAADAVVSRQSPRTTGPRTGAVVACCWSAQRRGAACCRPTLDITSMEKNLLDGRMSSARGWKSGSAGGQEALLVSVLRVARMSVL